MKIHEILDRDPRRSALVNNGQARITTSKDERALQELRAELETFVCDGQYGAAIERILASYLRQLDRPRQDSAWVSGFFGSGKSHLLKMLGHLWVDTAFEDGSTARALVRGLPDEIGAHLRELDVRVARSGKPAFAAAGALPSGSHDLVRLTVLSVVLRSCGLPEQYPQAQFCFWLREHGFLERVRDAVEEAGKDWQRELNNLYASPLLAQAVLACDADFAQDEREARQVLRSRFPLRTTDLTTPEFLAAVREALAPDGDLPLSILVLDEVQQFIGDSTDRSVIVSELAEAVQTQLDSKVMLVASGQSALASTPQLQRLCDRFRITAQLSDTDVEAVTRKVLLHKKASAVEPVRTVLERNAGEVAKHLQGTRLAERVEDRQTIVDDYPLLPTRRRFWEECFRRVDAAGTHSQLRSQLCILHDALQSLAEKDIGAVIPADALYRAIAPNLVNTGVLLNEIATRIQALDDGTPVGALRHRLCGLVFLISKLPREVAVDTGVRASAKTIADLLVEDLQQDSGPLRRQVEQELESLAQETTLMKVGDEYRLQTTEGAEWDRAFREKAAALRQQENELAIRRDQLLSAAIQKIVGEIRFSHGASKLRRTLALHARQDPPPTGTGEVVVWLRDGFSSSQKEVENEARRLGQESPILHVFLPRMSAEDLRSRMVEAEAARSVIDTKGVPKGREGEEARQSMQSRLAAGEAERDEVVRGIVGAARVYQGGGSELFGESLRQKLETAVESSLARLFPRFSDADQRSSAWEAALKRAREGSDQPFVPVGWHQATEDHPVVREVLARIGGSARGGEVRKHLEAAPYGWPRDAIDAALVALHRAGTIRATLNGQPVAPGHLDQAKIQSSEFRPEKVRLGTAEKLALRGLYQEAGVPVRSGEEELKAPQFLDALLDLARAAGGDPPLPPCPPATRITDLKRLTGSEQLGGILAAKSELETLLQDWKARRQRAEERVPGWSRLERLGRHAAALPIAAEVAPELEAIRAGRSLLDDTDRVTSLIKKVAKALRAAVTEQGETFREAYASGLATLAADPAWTAMDAALQGQILEQVGLAAPATPSIGTDEDLLRELDRQSLAARAAAAAACPELAARALTEAVRRRKPEARRVTLRAAMLADEAQVRAWLDEQETRLLEAVRSGPVIVG
ncbi:MAG: BREX system P-loop protein BrxC [Planctomycetota bacterium]